MESIVSHHSSLQSIPKLAVAAGSASNTDAHGNASRGCGHENMFARTAAYAREYTGVAAGDKAHGRAADSHGEA